MAVLVTGGAGYIGSHTVVELQNAGYDVVVMDNLCNSSEKSLERVETITGKKVPFYKADILDLAKGHVKALKKIEEKAGLNIYNLGTGTGYSVLDIVKNFEAANNIKVPYVIKDRRPGDIATCYADAKKAKDELGWEAENGIKEMCEDSWRWQSNNPNGYEM